MTPELLYKEFFNFAPTPLIVTDSKGEIKLINEQALTLLDNKALEFSGLNFCDFIDNSFLKDYLHPKTSFSFEEFLKVYQTEHKHWVKSKEGRTIYADIKAVATGSGDDAFYIWTFDPIEISKKLSYDLKERVKEQLAILNVIEVFFQNSDIHTDLKLCLPAIQAGWQYPKVTAVRIVLTSGEEFATANFQKTEWLLQAKIMSATTHFGFLEVCYLQEIPTYGGSIFLYEEERLIFVLAQLLGIFIERWQAFDQIESDAARLKKITSQVPANTYQFEILSNGGIKVLFLNKGNDPYNYTAEFKDFEDDPSKILEVIYEPDKIKYKEAFLKANETKDFLSVYYRVVLNDTIRWRWLRAIPENTTNGKTMWYGATQDITSLVDYITSIEQMLFDTSHIMRRPIANILGITQLIKSGKLTEGEWLYLAKSLLEASKELDFFVQQLNISYEKKRKLNQDLDINFSALIDKRASFFDRPTQP
ncbi:hypothetical protein [Adhaeribacter radiodurans]|uniref:PAS domain-containing protein n=1 Tax=Adhaeribacter radiodurans TaxID=2745197 RepID=A0A7L7L4W6_9BACT|nr:hypothetical protein [Adhaeribacter radiodurans]QMU27848.1 hypothetical protein HUW48_07245 [Adhaeribacter radiodurans]